MQGTVAIDLGSTTTVVAYQAPGQTAELLALHPYALEQPCVVPSLLWLSASGDTPLLIGRQVIDAGLAHGDTPQLLRDFKRQISNDPRATAAAEQLLLQLWGALPQQLAPSRLVLTAPIESYAGYRQWLLQVAERFNVAEVALVDEPTAAAIGSGLAPGSRVLVVDLGGSTIDLSLVELPGGQGRAAPIAQLLRLGGRNLDNSRQALRLAKVIGKAGLALGGRDIDRWIAAALCPGQVLTGELLAQAERLKCALSSNEQARAIWRDPQGRSHDLQLDRQGLARLLEHQGLIAQLDALLEAVLAQARAAGLGLEQINALLAVGGSSRLEPIELWLKARLGSIPRVQTNPVEAVALGALALTPGVAVRDVLDQGVSLRCWDRRSGSHRWHPLYVPGQSWPTEQPLELLLACSRDGQEAIELVLGQASGQGRAEVIYDNGLPRLRSREAGPGAVTPWSVQPEPLLLTPPGRQGQDRLRLRFGIDDRCRLQVSIDDLEAGGSQPQLRDLGTLR